MARVGSRARQLRIALAAKQVAAPVWQPEDWESAAERPEAHWEMGEESEGDDTEDECEMPDPEHHQNVF